jgi:predicted DNA-binding transcriptional regulator YafY
MSRSQRLLDLIQLLRTHRYAVTGEALSRELGVSLRTVYRDIETLQSQGAPIEGEAGVGYILRPGFLLPPLMFSVEEIEALVLGVSWVSNRADATLAKAAANLLSKIQSVLPAALARELEATTLIVGPSANAVPVADDLGAALRQAIREERRLRIGYDDGRGNVTERTIWPFGLGYFDGVLIAMAWCELRQDLRHFRADRITQWTMGLPYPESRMTLLDRWRIREGLNPKDIGS